MNLQATTWYAYHTAVSLFGRWRCHARMVRTPSLVNNKK